MSPWSSWSSGTSAWLVPNRTLVPSAEPATNSELEFPGAPEIGTTMRWLASAAAGSASARQPTAATRRPAETSERNRSVLLAGEQLHVRGSRTAGTTRGIDGDAACGRHDPGGGGIGRRRDRGDRPAAVEGQDRVRYLQRRARAVDGVRVRGVGDPVAVRADRAVLLVAEGGSDRHTERAARVHADEIAAARVVVRRPAGRAAPEVEEHHRAARRHAARAIRAGQPRRTLQSLQSLWASRSGLVPGDLLLAPLAPGRRLGEQAHHALGGAGLLVTGGEPLLRAGLRSGGDRAHADETSEAERRDHVRVGKAEGHRSCVSLGQGRRL